jgi:hypothetical protein
MNDDTTSPVSPPSSPPPRGDLEPGATQPTSLPPGPAAWPQPAGPPPRSNRKWFVTLAVVVVVAIALLLAANVAGSSGAGVPDEFAGAERVDSGPMADFFDAFSEPFDELGVEVEFAIYGGDFDPRYMILAMEGPGLVGGGNMGQQFGQGFAGGMGAQVDMTEAIEDTEGTAEYMCVPATSDQFAAFGGKVAMCMFMDGDEAAVVMAFRDEDLNGLMTKTKELHDQLVA